MSTLLIFIAIVAAWLKVGSCIEALGPDVVFLGFPLGLAGVVLFLRLAVKCEGRFAGGMPVLACAMVAVAMVSLWHLRPIVSVVLDVASLFPYRPFLAMLVFHLLILLLGYTFYSQARGLVKSAILARAPNDVIIMYAEHSGIDTSRKGFVIATRDEVPRELLPTEYPFSQLEVADVRTVRVSQQLMKQLLQLLEAAGFFEMDATLYPYGAIDDTWRGLAVFNGTVGHQVTGYAQTEESRPLLQLVDSLERKLGE